MSIVFEIGRFAGEDLEEIVRPGMEDWRFGSNSMAMGIQLDPILATGWLRKFPQFAVIDRDISKRLRDFLNQFDFEEGPQPLKQDHLDLLQMIQAEFKRLHPEALPWSEEIPYGRPGSGSTEYHVAFAGAFIDWLIYWTRYALEHYKEPGFRWG